MSKKRVKNLMNLSELEKQLHTEARKINKISQIYASVIWNVRLEFVRLIIA